MRFDTRQRAGGYGAGGTAILGLIRSGDTGRDAALAWTEHGEESKYKTDERGRAVPTWSILLWSAKVKVSEKDTIFEKIALRRP